MELPFKKEEIAANGQRTIVLDGTVSAEVAWVILKWLEVHNTEYDSLVLDLSQAQSVHWLAVEILSNGVQSLDRNRKAGRIALKFGPETGNDTGRS